MVRDVADLNEEMRRGTVGEDCVFYFIRDFSIGICFARWERLG
jgi:hypothetical protein